MPFTNYNQGIASFGIPLTGPGSIYDMPCGRVWFVCNRSGVTSGDGTSRDRPLASLADAAVQIATTLPTLNDVIFVLSGHAENITASNTFSGSLVNTGAVAFPAGTRIICEGTGNQRPVFTFTAAASTLAFANAACSIENAILLCPQSGATTVAAFVTVTAVNAAVVNCNFQMAASATALATTGITFSSAANELRAIGNLVWGITGTPTSWMAPSGTTAPNRIYVLNNNVQLLLSSASGGCLDFSGASVAGPLDLWVQENTFINRTAASTVAAKFCATATGLIAYNNLGTINGSATTALTTTTLLQLIQNFVSQPNKFGLIAAPGGTSA